MLGVILAGGLSTRMGHDKALLRVEGHRVLERNRALLEKVCGQTLIVARNAEQAVSFELPTARIVTDLIPDCGPLGGIHTAFAHADDDLLVLACDLPYIEHALLDRLAAEFNQQRPRVLLPRTPKENDWRDQPLCAIWSRDCKAEVAAAIGARNFALYRLIQTWPHVLRVNLSAADAPQLRNVNTPEDLSSL